ncbi:multiple sugar-binding protein [Paenibacillus baekrokdamisoli]|uniref:Multiple sugar-binding protein n=1 Tax=Paenibacillus baekrokdamisoli TaxID=1712516 RepID=A0A3G9IYV9_9BACL|nr:extracellular solute-binding protein [Paenibacillus baekrokdamisoli]MBB3071926.1 raffinose/stachyose/melibiose transport system substrate-binding protein [Paenibacillus baekrokdamisoli]BBH24090.1 multiple sugar-binding protein [Paenibacillus baekrokdamisoli]
MKKRGMLITLSLLIVAMVVLSGCGGKNENDTVASAGNQKESSAAGENVTLKFISWWSYLKPELFKKFEDANPGVKIDYEYVAAGDAYNNKIKTLTASNDLPDVFGIQGVTFESLIKTKDILDLKSAFTTPAYDKSTAWGDTMNPVLIDNMNSGLTSEVDARNHVWGVPFGAVSVVVVYNKSLFDGLGLKAPATWAEFESNNKRIKEAGVIPMSYANKVGWGDWWLRFLLDQSIRNVTTDDFLTGKAKVTDPGFVEAVAKLKEMWDSGTFDPAGMTNGVDETQALFVQQKMAQYMVVPENFIQYLQQNMPKEVELGAYALPAWKGIEPSRTLGGASNIVAVSAKTKHQEAAIKLAKFLTSESTFQSLAESDVVPSTKGYKPPEGDKIMGAYAKAAENGFIVEHTPGNEAGIKLFQDALPKILIGNEPIEQSLAEVQALIDKNVKK